MNKFEAHYKPKATRPDKPILIGRAQSQARVSLSEAQDLVTQLNIAIVLTKQDIAARLAKQVESINK